MPLPSEKKEQYTYADYMCRPDDERWEIIEGVPYDMSPAPSTRHQEVSGELFFHIKMFLKETGSCKVFHAPYDVRLSEADEADDEIVNVLQPDIAVICDPSKIDERGCRGVPDWIIEVLSPHTASRDFIQKRSLYEKYGVREYWLVHPLDCLVTVFVLGDDGKFDTPSFHEGKETVQVSVLPGFSIDLNVVFEL